MSSPSHDTTVLLNGHKAGTLHNTSEGLVFEYAPSWVGSTASFPASVAFRLDNRVHADGNFPASVAFRLDNRVHADGKPERWLEGLVPGPAPARNRLASAHQADSDKPIDLLRTPAGHDCAGALQFTPAGLEHQAIEQGSQTVMTRSEITDLIMSMHFDPKSWGSASSETGPFSLPGAFPKKTISFAENGDWLECSGNQPSTWILKPSTEIDQGLATNEFICLRTIANLGIRASRCRLLLVDGVDVLAVKRFDRVHTHQSTHRSHCEDLHLAMNNPKSIYQRRGGATPSEIAAHLRKHKPLHIKASAVVRYLNQLTGRWLMWDTDGHTKNYAHIVHPKGAVLSPMYDVWSHAARVERDPYALSHSVTVYPEGKEQTTLVRGGDSEDYWRAMSHDLRLRWGRVQRFLDSTASRFGDACAEAISEAQADGGDPDAIDAFSDMRRRRLEKLTDAGWNTSPVSPAQPKPKPKRTPKRSARQSARVAPLGGERCNRLMPRARRRCVRRKGHPGNCQ